VREDRRHPVLQHRADRCPDPSALQDAVTRARSGHRRADGCCTPTATATPPHIQPDSEHEDTSTTTHWAADPPPVLGYSTVAAGDCRGISVSAHVAADMVGLKTPGVLWLRHAEQADLVRHDWGRPRSRDSRTGRGKSERAGSSAVAAQGTSWASSVARP